MKACCSLRNAMTVLCFAAGTLLPASVTAQAAPSGGDPGKWQFTAIIYGYFPTIDGSLSFPAGPGSGESLNVDASTILDHLKFTFMGTLDAHNGRWGMFTDVIYIDVGGNKSQTRDFSIGEVGLPASTTADLDFNLKATVWTLAGQYRVVSDPAWTVDLLAGARMLDVKPSLGWSIHGDLGPISAPGRSGSKDISDTVWDGIVGVKARYAFGDDRRWYMPVYLDVGTGDSQLTWQGAIGAGYRYNWGSLLALYRYLDWNAKSGKPIEDLSLSGPMIGVAFQW
jgi:hypothetical protein